MFVRLDHLEELCPFKTLLDIMNIRFELVIINDSIRALLNSMFIYNIQYITKDIWK